MHSAFTEKPCLHSIPSGPTGSRFRVSVILSRAQKQLCLRFQGKTGEVVAQQERILLRFRPLILIWGVRDSSANSSDKLKFVGTPLQSCLLVPLECAEFRRSRKGVLVEEVSVPGGITEVWVQHHQGNLLEKRRTTQGRQIRVLSSRECRKQHCCSYHEVDRKEKTKC